MSATAYERALEALDVFVGEWEVEASFDPDPDFGPARASFEWALDRTFLLQRSQVPHPEAPDSLSVIAADPESGAYTQHYFDSRGVVRVYEMTLADGAWTLLRTAADFSPLPFAQRYTGASRTVARRSPAAGKKRQTGRIGSSTSSSITCGSGPGKSLRAEGRPPALPLAFVLAVFFVLLDALGLAFYDLFS